MSTSQKVIQSTGVNHIRLGMACSVMALAIATSAPAHAQTAAPAAAQADDSKLEDVVVTARKRSESIDTIPLAITAMTSEKIEERNLKSIEDVAAFSPGFFTQEQTGTGAGRNDRSFRQMNFRGIGASSTNVGVLAGGVAFLDGSPVLNSSLSNVQDWSVLRFCAAPRACTSVDRPSLVR